MDQLLERYKNWMELKNYSKKTINAYLCTVRKFYKYCESKKSDDNFEKRNAVEEYLLYRFKTLSLSWQSINVDYSALQLLYVRILGRDWDSKKLPRPRQEKYLPKVMSKREVEMLLENASCVKHEVYFLLLYSSGIRLGESLNMLLEDIDSERMEIRVRVGKGNKMRQTLLCEEVLEKLEEYVKLEKPKKYLFNGRRKGSKWSERGAQLAIQTTRRKAGLGEHVTAHSLRHSFATHLLEGGTDLVSVQKLLGHKHLKTTSRYIHLKSDHFRRIENPVSSLWVNTKRINCLKNGEKNG